MIKKHYEYKVYDGATYKGLINPAIISNPFSYSQDLGTSYASLRIDLAATLDDTGATLSNSYLITESGDHILTDTGAKLLVSSDYIFPDIPISPGYGVDVYVFYGDEPNGHRVFSGYISSFSFNTSSNSISLNVFSWGIKMDEFLVKSPDNYIIAVSPTDGNFISTYTASTTPANRTTVLGNTFSVLTDTEFGGVGLYVANNGAAQLKITLLAGTPSDGSVIASNTIDVPNSGGLYIQRYTLFDNTPLLTAGVTYSFTVEKMGMDNPTVLRIYQDSAGSYTSGQKYVYNDVSGWTTPGGDLTFFLLGSPSTYTAEYNSYDPGDIVDSLLSSFDQLGGRITHGTDPLRGIESTATTSTTVSYTYKFHTYLEAIRIAHKLAPSNWYWFVDPGSNYLYFQPQSTSADHTFIKGKHIGDLDLEYTTEGMANHGIFSGGDTGSGSNLVRRLSNDESITKYGQFLDRISDGRVTRTDTADTLLQGSINQRSAPSFRTKVVIYAKDTNGLDGYDIETIFLGQMVEFRNYNNIIDTLTLQIVGIDRNPDYVTLHLDTMLPTVTHRIEDVRRNLEMQQTLNNEDTFA